MPLRGPDALHKTITMTAALILGLGLVAQAGQFCSGEHIETVEGQVRLGRQWVTYEESFEGGLEAWQLINYDPVHDYHDGIAGALQIGLDGDAHSGRHSLMVTRSGERVDTAFEVTSTPIAIQPDQEYTLRFWCKQNRDLRRVSGWQDKYWTQIQWRNAEGKPTGEVVAFGFGARWEPGWQERIVTAVAPPDAMQVVLRMGFDSPDLHSGGYLRIDDITLTVTTDPPKYQTAGSLISGPLRVMGDEGQRIEWEAQCPPATRVQFQVRSADDAGGGPGQWGPFCGPDGKADSFYARNGTELGPAHKGRTWLQYRAQLTTTDQDQTPVLTAVRIVAGEKSVVDSNWTWVDRDPPTLVEYSPTRTANASESLVFKLTDNANGVGLDRSTVQLFLDGKEVTGELQPTGDNTFRYSLKTSLEPRSPLDFMAWRTNNYRGALRIEELPSANAGEAKDFRVSGPQQPVDTAFSLISSGISVQGGAEYTLSYRSRHNFIPTSVAVKPHGFYSTAVTWRDESGQTVTTTPIQPVFGEADEQWHRSRYPMTAPGNAREAIVSIGFDWPNLRAGQYLELSDVRIEGPHPLREDAPNLHKATVRAADLAGNQLNRDWYILVAPPLDRGRVTVRDDGIILIDGEPFFPIGMYAVWKRDHNNNDFDQAFRELAEAGFNTAHTYHALRGPEMDEFYRAAQRHGFKVFLAARTGANSSDTDTICYDVAHEQSQSALLAWYLADDTSGHMSPSQLRAVHQAVRDIDPAHITSQADGTGRGPESTYTDYVDSTDAFLPELYPIRSDENDEVALIIRDMKKIQADFERAGQIKPVWAIVQDFQGWGWQRFPTNAEVRCMTYLAIIHGATGMTWYTYADYGDNHGAPHDPQVWANLKSIAHELATLHDVLVERDPAQTHKATVLVGPTQDGLDYPSISLRLKVHGGNGYLLAANSAEAQVKARIEVPDLAGAVEVMFEQRTVTAANGSFEDAFAPYAVHVYRW